jgi:two-component sensor histidine kinase
LIFTNLLLDIKHSNPKIVLLYRFHIVVILVNLFAIFIDIANDRYWNSLVEAIAIIFLFFNLVFLYRSHKLKLVAYIFVFTISTALLTLIYINHFASMSIVFILLMPLTTLLFLNLKESLYFSLLLVGTMAILLYFEYLNNSENIIAHNPKALFNLAYTAIIIYVVGLLYHFSILKTFDELDASNHQKAILLKEVHHRVKNNLNIIASIMGLHESTLSGKEREELLKSKSRIEAIALVHEMLYRDDKLESIDFNAYMKRLTNLLLGMYAGEQEITVDIKSNNIKMSLPVMVQLGIMINELFTNSIKYAFLNNRGNISIELQYHSNEYILIYSDDGKGYLFLDELLKSKSLGIRLIHLTAKQLKGSVEVLNEEGLKYKIRFKV